jgi:hypothetical protein
MPLVSFGILSSAEAEDRIVELWTLLEAYNLETPTLRCQSTGEDRILLEAEFRDQHDALVVEKTLLPAAFPFEVPRRALRLSH